MIVRGGDDCGMCLPVIIDIVTYRFILAGGRIGVVNSRSTLRPTITIDKEIKGQTKKVLKQGVHQVNVSDPLGSGSGTCMYICTYTSI